MIAVGIDISKAKFDVAVLVGKKPKHKVFDNQSKGFEALLNWLSKYAKEELHLCMEATNSYGFDLAEFAATRGYKVSIVNPAKIKAFAQSTLARNKTDKLDATLIAQFCLEKQPLPWQVPSAQMQEFRALARHWEALKQMRAQEQTRLDSQRIASVRDSLELHIAHLDQQISHLEATLDAILEDQPDLHAKSLLLDSIPGIGKTTAYMLLAEVPFEVFDAAPALVAFAGLNPKQHSSGKLKGRTTISKMGSSRLRKLLYMPALAAKRSNPLICPLAKRLKSEGHGHYFIACAAMRKLLHLAFGVIKSGIPFDPNYLNLPNHQPQTP